MFFQLYGSFDHFQSLALENDLIDCFLHLPMLENIPFILMYANITQAQPGDAQLQILRAQKPNQYIQKLLVPNLPLWCYQKAHNQPWRIYLPLLFKVVSPHAGLCGPGLIGRYNVIDILQSKTIQVCGGSCCALHTLSAM
jgi:hypothetical protein